MRIHGKQPRWCKNELIFWLRCLEYRRYLENVNWVSSMFVPSYCRNVGNKPLRFKHQFFRLWIALNRSIVENDLRRMFSGTMVSLLWQPPISDQRILILWYLWKMHEVRSNLIFLNVTSSWTLLAKLMLDHKRTLLLSDNALCPGCALVHILKANFTRGQLIRIYESQCLTHVEIRNYWIGNAVKKLCSQCLEWVLNFQWLNNGSKVR